jgi:hypothetical protein
MAVGRRKRRQESEALAAASAKPAMNPDPIMVRIMSLLASMPVTDDRILLAYRALAQNDFRAHLGPIEVVLRSGK